MASLAGARRGLPLLFRRMLASQRRAISATTSVCAGKDSGLKDDLGIKDVLKKEDEILDENTSKGYWNVDWKPGPIPETEEERVAAAKKYHLHPDDYQPIDPSSGMGYGDYPDLGQVPELLRDPYEDWDQPDRRRNYGDPVHIDQDLMTADRWTPMEHHRYSYARMIIVCISTFTLYVWLIGLSPTLSANRAEKQFPFDKCGNKNIYFTFEPAEPKM